ncbi:MAG: exosortase/archaeosortase family protein [Bryobacteraceae bacterium]|jgi:exosortase
MSAGTPTAPEELPSQQALRSFPWTAVVWFALLLIACYGPVLYRLAGQWAHDDDMGHGFFVPLVAGYIAWQRRRELLETLPAPSWWGLLILAWGAAQLYVAALGAELFLQRTAFIVSLVGVVLLLGGRPILRILAFPLFLLCFMVPIPAIVYNQVTFRLQLLASSIAEATLSLLGVPVLREGNILELASQQLSVVEACSGIRSLLTLSFLSLVYAYLFDKKVWMRWVLLLAAVPIALVANASRVTVTGLLSEANPELAEGVFHAASGWVIFMVGLALLMFTHFLVNRVYRFVCARKREAV